MKECFFVGIMAGMVLGGIGGIVLHKYCKEVQTVADEGEKLVKDEIKMLKQEAKKVKNLCK